jgi:hypothetical protein
MAEKRSGFEGGSRSFGVVPASLVALSVVAGPATAWTDGLAVPGADQAVAHAAEE